jgi:hypothetical protein
MPLCAQTAAAPPAQPLAQQPDLDELLRRTQENLWEYRGSIPDFFADEHVVSTMKQEGVREMKTTTDSVFRLVRSRTIGDEQTLNESREVRLVNKKPAHGDDLRGPAIFSGAFSSAPGVVSLEMSRCFDYTLESPTTLNKQPALVVGYIFRADMVHDDGCPGPDRESGRAWIDPTNFHILRIEMAIPNHVDNNGIHTLWQWTADFAPVDFDSRQFWMPKTITSRADANDGSAIWSFTATYSNYHKLTVKSRIVTDVEGNPPPPPQ